MPLANLPALSAVSERLDRLKIPYAFVGGSIVNLLLDQPEFARTRSTDDVDVIVQVMAGERYSCLEERLRELEFNHDMREGAPLCRWVLGALTVDIMPTDGDHLGLNTTWFKEALATASEQEFEKRKVRLISPTAFLVTKIVAFDDRGEKDYFGSRDFEDIITVLDGREAIVTEIDRSPPELRRVVVEAMRRMEKERDFDDALLGNLSTDSASEARLPRLRNKIYEIAKLSI